MLLRCALLYPLLPVLGWTEPRPTVLPLGEPARAAVPADVMTAIHRAVQTPYKAFDAFACSDDHQHWTPWEGPPLIDPGESWDREFAHKPWVLKHDGIVYHFHCAVGDQGRVIALATSRDLRRSPAP